MKRLAGYLVLFIVLGIATFWIAQKYLFIRVGVKNLTSKLVPPSKDIKQYLPQNSENSTQLTIPDGYSMAVFADLKDGMPRVLAFDDAGNLLASLTGQNKVVAVLDEDDDFKSDSQKDVLTGLNKPHGLAFWGGYLYVAETDGVSRYAYDPSTQTATGEEKLFSLPSGGRHFTRTIKIHDNKLYTSVGSSCDVCEESSPLRASILVSSLDGDDLKVYAKGLRNTVFFDFDNQGRMWGNDMGRDFLGDNLPPDELNIIEFGKDYGWPYCYGRGVRDSKFKPREKESYCSDTISPVYEYPAHVAPLGITFDSQGSILSAFHGSWNSSVPVGYKVVKLSVFAGGISGVTDYIKGFTKGSDVLGRPVGLALDSNNNLYISDDKTGVVYVLYR